MAAKPTIRDAWDYLYNQGTVGKPASKQAAAVDPLQIKREYFAQQRANLAIHKAMRVKA